MSRFPATILATCCVPWLEGGEVDEAIFRTSIRKIAGHGIDHLYVFGTAGEGHAVDERQFDDVVRIFVDELHTTEIAPMVGLIGTSLRTVVDRIERAAGAGVGSFQISLPSWGALNDKELFAFFDETCGRFPGLRFLHYNLPRALRIVTPAEYAILAERHENLVATKNAGAGYSTIVQLLEQAGALRHFFTEPGYAYGSMFGPCGFLVSMALLNPRLAREYFDAGARGDARTVAALARELTAVTACLQAEVGTAHMDGAFDKCISKVHDPDFPLRLLPPYEGTSDEAFARFLGTLRAQFPQWLPGG